MSVTAALHQHMQTVTQWLAGRSIQPELAGDLSTAFPADGDWRKTVESLCHQGMASGELGPREASGIRYGRVFKPEQALNGFSLDAVLMDNVKGPHHGHPQGEIDLVIPLDPGARFDGSDQAWVVYPPGSAHHPTVTEGRAIVLYLLPDGQIDFTRH